MTLLESDDATSEMAARETRRGLARVLAGVVAIGAIEATGQGEAGARKRRAKRRKAVGPQGPQGPAGPAGEPVTFATVTAERSAVLGAAVGSEVESVAECGPGSIPLNCGWSFLGNAEHFDRTAVQVEPGSFRGVGRCVVRMRRTATVGSAGGQAVATALCTR